MLGASLAVSDWSVVVVSAHAGDEITCKKNSKSSLINSVVQSHEEGGRGGWEELTILFAACPVRHSFNGGDSLNSTTTHGHADCGFGNYRLIYLNHVYKDKSFNAILNQTVNISDYLKSINNFF